MMRVLLRLSSCWPFQTWRTIVRATIGLASIAGGVGIGALVDGLQSRSPSPQRGFGATRPRISGVQMSVRF